MSTPISSAQPDIDLGLSHARSRITRLRVSAVDFSSELFDLLEPADVTRFGPHGSLEADPLPPESVTLIRAADDNATALRAGPGPRLAEFLGRSHQAPHVRRSS